jgi:hypothetical protein
MRVRELIAAAAVLALAGCSAVRPAPVVQGQTLKIPPGSLKRIAVMPFTHKDTMRASPEAGATSPEIAAELVARFLTDAMSKRGIDVIPASDLATALNAQGLRPTDINPRTAADLAAARFGATAIMMAHRRRTRTVGSGIHDRHTAPCALSRGHWSWRISSSYPRSTFSVDAACSSHRENTIARPSSTMIR